MSTQANTQQTSGGRCSYLPPSVFTTFFDNTTQHWDFNTRAYLKPEGSLDPEYLKVLFATLERNIIRMVLHRCLPEYKKEIDGRARIYVASLTEAQWEKYKERHQNTCNPPINPIHCRSLSIPGFVNKVKERVETLEWTYGTHQWPIPIIDNDPFWCFNKWVDEDNRLWRSWLTDFSLQWNSWNSTVSVGFEYRVQHWSSKFQVWIQN